MHCASTILVKGQEINLTNSNQITPLKFQTTKKQTNKFQPHYSPLNSKQTNSNQITLLKFQTNKFQPKYSNQIPTKQTNSNQMTPLSSHVIVTHPVISSSVCCLWFCRSSFQAHPWWTWSTWSTWSTTISRARSDSWATHLTLAIGHRH